MVPLSQTSAGVFYLHDYIPRSRAAGCDEEVRKRTEEILLFKSAQPKAIYRFSMELALAMVRISERRAEKTLILVCVPPSKVNKYSLVRGAIQFICQLGDSGVLRRFLDCEKRFLDGSQVLLRTKDVSPSHGGERFRFEEQMSSTACRADFSGIYQEGKEGPLVVLLDDIITTGTSMAACTQVLMKANVPGEKILRMVVGRTVYG